MTSTYKSQNGTAKLLGLWSSEHCINGCFVLVRPGSPTHTKIKKHLGTQRVGPPNSPWMAEHILLLSPCPTESPQLTGRSLHTAWETQPFSCLHGGDYCHLGGKKPNRNPQHFCITNNPASHTADEQVLPCCRRGI